VQVAHLLELMRERLLLMHDVAHWKWKAGQPIADPQREEAFLARMIEEGKRRGLGGEFTQQFFRAQVEAAKLVQRDCFQRWQEQPPDPRADVPDLATVQRQRIDALSMRLLDALALVYPFREQAQLQALLDELAEQHLKGEGLSREVRQACLAPLGRL
jgi:chorismate mutase